jgi:hypothetical protein
MRRITIKCARTWHYGKMRLFIEQSNALAPSLPFQSWLDCTTNMSGYDFRKGQPIRQIAENAGVEGSIVVGKVTDHKSPSFGFDCPNRRIWRPDHEGHHRPGQGREGRFTGREFRRWPPGHNGSDGCRKAEEGYWLSGHAGRRYGWDGLLGSARRHLMPHNCISIEAIRLAVEE